MTFANQPILVLMAATLPLLTLFLVWAWKKKQKLVAQFVQSRLLAALTVGVSPARQKVRITLLVGAVASLFLALAQPQWGFAWEEAKQHGLDIVVAIDTSRSMLAQDVPPNRLTRAKLAALDLMKAAKTDRLGLVAFAGTAFLQCPLTLDDEAFRQSVAALDVGVIPQGGTAITEAIQAALSAFKDEGENFKVLVLFTDGEDHEEGAVEAAQKAAKAGLKIFTIGVGTGEGELLRHTDEKGVTSFIKDDAGKPVKSQLNEKLLRQIAEAAGGFYLPLRGANIIESLYKQGLAPLPKSDIATKRMKHLHERFQWPLAFAIVLLCVELFLPERKRVQRTEEIAAAPNAELRQAVALLLLLVGLPAMAFGSPSTARRQYESGRYDDALFEYQKLLEKKPDDDRLNFNAGAAAYKAREFDAATKNFEAALQSRDLGLQQRSYYNLGNTFFQQGDAAAEPQQKMGAWDQAVKSFESALKLNAQDPDARHNLEFVKKRLEELKQQQQKKDQSKNDSDKDKDEQKSDNSQKDQQQDKDKQSEQKKNKDDKKQDQKEQQEKSEQAKKDEEKKEQEKQAAQNGGEKKEDEQNGEESQSAQAQPGQMTKQQAQQLLDAQKGDEKVMMFVPQDKAKSRSRAFKDW